MTALGSVVVDLNLYDYCIAKQYNHFKILSTVKSIVSIAMAIFTGMALGIVLSPVGGVLLGIVSYVLYDTLVAALINQSASRKFETVADALRTGSFIDFANARGVSLNKETVMPLYKSYAAHQRQLLANV